MLAAVGDQNLGWLHRVPGVADRFLGHGLAEIGQARGWRVLVVDRVLSRLDGRFDNGGRRGKVGSPAPKLMTGSPAAFIALALASIAKVTDSDTAATRSDTRFIDLSFSHIDRPVFSEQSADQGLQEAAKAVDAEQ